MRRCPELAFLAVSLKIKAYKLLQDGGGLGNRKDWLSSEFFGFLTCSTLAGGGVRGLGKFLF